VTIKSLLKDQKVRGEGILTDKWMKRKALKLWAKFLGLDTPTKVAVIVLAIVVIGLITRIMTPADTYYIPMP